MRVLETIVNTTPLAWLLQAYYPAYSPACSGVCSSAVMRVLSPRLKVGCPVMRVSPPRFAEQGKTAYNGDCKKNVPTRANPPVTDPLPDVDSIKRGKSKWERNKEKQRALLNDRPVVFCFK